MSIQQESLFSLEELMELQPKTRLEMIFSNLDLTKVARKIRYNSNKGPQGYNPLPIVRAFLVQQLEEIPTRKALIKRLKQDPILSYACGFGLIGKIPSEATFSRYYKKLSESNTLEKLYSQLIEQAEKLDLLDLENIAIDSTKLESYESPKPKKQVNKDNPKTPDWGAKFDSHNNKITWFGWKLHMACDTKSELPLVFNITPANQSDSENALPLVEELTGKIEKHSWRKPDYWIMDSGYDATEIYEKIHFTYNAQAIIPINKRNANQPPTGFYDFKGTPECSAGHKMVYWGHYNGCNKFRCPHVLGKVDCVHGSIWCSKSNYGRVVKTRVKDNPRFISIPHRDSKTWDEIYNKRTSIERCFSRLKDLFNLENLTVRGAKKVKTHVLLNCIGLLASKLAVESGNLTKLNAA